MFLATYLNKITQIDSGKKLQEFMMDIKEFCWITVDENVHS